MRDDGRRHLGGQLSAEAYEGWHGFARANGVTVAALLEVTGCWLGEHERPRGAPWAGLVAAARDITAERRQRG